MKKWFTLVIAFLLLYGCQMPPVDDSITEDDWTDTDSSRAVQNTAKYKIEVKKILLDYSGPNYRRWISSIWKNYDSTKQTARTPPRIFGELIVKVDNKVKYSYAKLFTISKSGVGSWAPETITGVNLPTKGSVTAEMVVWASLGAGGVQNKKKISLSGVSRQKTVIVIPSQNIYW